MNKKNRRAIGGGGETRCPKPKADKECANNNNNKGKQNTAGKVAMKRWKTRDTRRWDWGRKKKWEGKISAGADTIYTHGQEGRTQVERGKGEKKNVNIIIFWHLFFLISFASQFDPVFFFNLAKFLYFSTKKFRFFFPSVNSTNFLLLLFGLNLAKISI